MAQRAIPAREAHHQARSLSGDQARAAPAADFSGRGESLRGLTEIVRTGPVQIAQRQRFAQLLGTRGPGGTPAARPGPVAQLNGTVVKLEGTKYDVKDKARSDALLAALDDPFNPLPALFACVAFHEAVKRNSKTTHADLEQIKLRLVQLAEASLAQCIEFQDRDPMQRILKAVGPYSGLHYPEVKHGVRELHAEFLVEAQKIARAVQANPVHELEPYLARMDDCLLALTGFVLKPFDRQVFLRAFKAWPVAQELLRTTPIQESRDVPASIVAATAELEGQFPQQDSKHDAKLPTALSRGIPLGFESREKFVWFIHKLMPALTLIHGNADLTGVVLIFQGSSVNGQSYWAKESDEDPNRLVKKFDEGRISDFDIGLVCPALWQKVVKSGIKRVNSIESDKPSKPGRSGSGGGSAAPAGERTAAISLKNRATAKALAILDLLKDAQTAARICSTAPREVNFMVYSSLDDACHHQGPSLSIALAQQQISYLLLTGQFEEGKQTTKQSTVAASKRK